MRNFRGEKMSGICIKTPRLYSHSIFPPRFSPFLFFPPLHMQPFLNHAVATLWLYSLYFLLLPLSLHLYHSLTLPSPSMGLALAPSLRLRQGVSEWWSFSGPWEWSCGFSVPHIRGRALALCMLQEFSLAENQALTTSSVALAAARAVQTNYLSPAHNIREIMSMSHCLYLYSLSFIRTYVCFYCINFLTIPWHRMTWSKFLLAALKGKKGLYLHNIQ